MAEEVLGIQCYVNDVPGFSGVLKHRYADFCVNEVDLEGNVVQLTSLRPNQETVNFSPASSTIEPSIAKDSPSTVVPNAPSHDSAVPTLEAKLKTDTEAGTERTADKPPLGDVSAAVTAFRELAGAEDAAKLEAMLGAINAGEQVQPLILQPDESKEHRTAVHTFFKSRLPMLITDTVDFKGARCFAPSDGKVPNEVSQKSVRIHLDKKWGKGNAKKRSNDDQRGNREKRLKSETVPIDSREFNTWPKDRPRHLRFTLYKENKDSHEAMGLIGGMLNVPSKAFGFAGTKDKRGVTVQHVTLHKVTAERAAALNPRLYSMQTGNFTYVPEGLSLGQLSGNQFAITLRSVPSASQEHAVAAAQALQRQGFVNYFGLQRFGSGTVKTHEVGAALLKGAFKQAVDLVLAPRGDEREDAKAARAYFARTRDAAGTLKMLPHYMNAERNILQRLRGAPNDWVGSMALVPRTLRMMYVHAYQSYLWNHAATHRIMLYGSERAVEGDLVFAGESDILPAAVSTETEEDAAAEDTVDFDVPASHRVKHVTKEEAEAGTYSIEDVLLPLPGGATQYPLHETERVYADVARQHGVDLQRCHHNVKEYSISNLTGGYRKLLQKPRDFEWQLIQYSDPNQPLWPTAIDRIASQPKPPNWLARFRQSSNNKGSPPAKDALTALRSSVRLVRGRIESEASWIVPEEGGTDTPFERNGMEADAAIDPSGAKEMKPPAEEPLLSPAETSKREAVTAESSKTGEIVQSETVEASNGAKKQSPAGGRAEVEGGPSSKEGGYLALQIKMTLPSSCYATMAIRELLKSSTSKDFHKELQRDSNR